MGCCCGHPERGGPKTVPGILKRQMRRAFREAKLEGLRLAFSDCLGPCSEANVVLLYLQGRPLWFRRMNAPELVSALLDYSSAAVAGDEPTLPAELGTHSFSWTGGGVGPAPPVDAPAS